MEIARGTHRARDELVDANELRRSDDEMEVVFESVGAKEKPAASSPAASSPAASREPEEDDDMEIVFQSIKKKPVNNEDIPSTSRSSDQELQPAAGEQVKQVIKPSLGPDGLPVVGNRCTDPDKMDTALSRAFSAMFGPMKNRNSYSDALKKYPEFIGQWLRFNEFKSMQVMTKRDIKDAYRGTSLQQLKRDMLVDIYRQYDSLDKLQFLTESEQLKLSLPTCDELLLNANNWMYFRTTAYKLMKIAAQGGKNVRNLGSLHWSKLDLEEIKSRGPDFVSSMTKSEKAQFVFEGYKHLNIEIADDFVQRASVLDLHGLIKSKKKLRLRCDRCEEVKDDIKFLRNSANKIVNLKLCQSCVGAFGPMSLHQQILNVDVESADDIQNRSEQALDELRLLSEEFLNEIEFPVVKRGAIYTVTVDELSNKLFYDYAGFTSSERNRIRTHVAFVEVFRRFKLVSKVESSYYKYSVWAQQLERGATISVKTVFGGCNPAFSLLMETLCFQLTDGKFNLETDSNILPEQFQPADGQFFYLLKAIEQNLEITDAEEFTLDQTKRLNLEPIARRFQLNEHFNDFRNLYYYIFSDLKSIWKNY